MILLASLLLIITVCVCVIKCSELNSILFNSLRVQLPTIKLLQSNLMERRCNNTILVVSVWAVVVAKLTEQSFPMQEVCVGTSVTRGLF